MKIPLNMVQNEQVSAKQAQAKALERDLLAAQKGDWNAKNSLARSFMPLMVSLVQKRATEEAQTNTLLEAAKEGLFKAAKKYRPGNPEQFHIDVVDYIEKAIDGTLKPRGFFVRLFGG
jgi:DNA-directed RNA polymerase specialized sigma subunit